MHVTHRDLLSTFATAALAVYAIAYLAGADVPLAPNTRAVVLVVYALGQFACSVSGVGQSSFRRPAVIALAVLGGATFVVALLALATGSTTVLAVLVAMALALWALATLRHLLGGAVSPRRLPVAHG